MESLPFFLLLLTIITFTGAAAQTQSNITLNSVLTTATAGARNLSWLSPSGDFAFGFLPLPTNSSLFLLAIWYANLPNTKTLIWTPNRDNPLPPNSSVILTSDGLLSLQNPAGTEVWNPGAPAASYAAMLDTGDFVLAASNDTFLWESFSDPTDTILPTQTLSPNSKLVAKLSDDDFSDGRFKLAMQSDGDLVFYQIAVPTGFQYSSYWASNTNTSNSRLVFNISGSIDLVSPTGALITTLTSSTTKSTSDFYHRGTVDPDGVFRHYVHPKPSANAGAVTAEWVIMDFQPSDICNNLFASVGSGVCGFNSYCTYDSNNRVVCQCAVGHSWVDPNRAYIGCQLNFTMPSCTAGAQSGGLQMVRVDNINYWGTDYDHLNPMNETDCAQNCLDDCFCATAIHDGGSSCWKKKLPLANGVKGINVKGTAFMKLGSDDNLPIVIVSKKRTWILPGSLALGFSVVLNFIILSLTIMFLRASKRKERQKLKDSILGPNLKAFTYKELEEATKGFGEELGRGACGTVYKGYLGPELTGIPDIAVKKLRDLQPEIDKEFTNEVKSIGQTHHKNLVRLLGYCNEDTKRLLVYEYMSNGSLASYLFSGIRPPWEQRVEIMLGIARGLRYVHEECGSQIIHCDIKPQNVLLDDNFVPRISDFGLAKLLQTDQTRTNTGIRGTKGYVAPEWFRNTGISAKVDVYSFGVMILEILCCRKNVEKEMAEEKALLAFWASDCYSDGRIDALVEGDEEAMANMGRVEKFVMVALWCVQDEPSLRPTMGQVTQMLEGTAGINPVPPYK